MSGKWKVKSVVSNFCFVNLYIPFFVLFNGGKHYVHAIDGCVEKTVVVGQAIGRFWLIEPPLHLSNKKRASHHDYQSLHGLWF